MIFKIKCIAYLLLLLAYTTLRIFDLTCIMRLIIFMVSFGLVAQVNAGRWDKYAENYKAGRNKVRALRGTVGGADQLRGDVSGSKHYAAALDVDGNDNTDQHGKLKVSDGATYIGDLKQGMFEGHGTLYARNGDIYTGDFLNGQYSGNGILTQKSTGNRFDGKFKEGAINGVGVLTCANGDKYQGNFVKGLLNGPVRCDFADGSTLQGTFENGVLMSSGIHRSDAGTITFQGLRGSGERNKHVTAGGSMTAEFS
jgi:hypothetical protein